MGEVTCQPATSVLGGAPLRKCILVSITGRHSRSYNSPHGNRDWEVRIYKHILVPTDGSALAAKAISQAVALASALGATLTVVTVTAPLHIFAERPLLLSNAPEELAAYAANRISEEASRSLAAARTAAKLANVPCDTLQVEYEQPYMGIIDTAKSRRCDLIVMASHNRRGISAILLGSETLKVLTHSTIPVLVCR